MRIGSTLLTIVLASVFVACQTNTGTVADKKATQGAVLGALAGAAAGAAIGGHDHRAGGAIVGAATGAVAGGLVGHYLDKQAQELDAIPGATVQRRDDSLLVNFESEILFDTNSAILYPGSFDRLRSLAQTLNRYPKSDVIIKGHTDSAGEESYNQTLSERRADTVREFLIAQGVATPRITAIGFGETVPVASNATPEGRQRNRRVEIEIRPYDEVLRGGGTQ
jgi:outer membrane protein OmpA-like peptidoglycan-associated protein